MLKLAALLVLPLAASAALAQDKPPANFASWDVCPFECCKYQDWTAEQPVALHASRSERSPVIARVRKGEVVRGVTGVVMTAKPAPITVDKAVREGDVTLAAGEKVYLLSPLGEGAYLFWRQGKVYHSVPGMEALPGVDAKGAGMVWWKLVKTKSGKSGWTRSNAFGNVDACG